MNSIVLFILFSSIGVYSLFAIISAIKAKISAINLQDFDVDGLLDWSDDDLDDEHRTRNKGKLMKILA